MAYIDFEYYTNLYGEIPETDFNRLSWEACRKLDAFTTGIDGVRKLKVAFPTDEEDAEIVKRCACEVLRIMQQLKEAEETAMSEKGYTETENGFQSKVISSVSAGNESISYAVGSNATASTLIDKALSDKDVQEQLFRDTIRNYLTGVTDSNGVNLLFMGRYPYCVGKE